MTSRILVVLAGAVFSLAAWSDVSQQQVETALQQVDTHVIAWRRDFHRHPELGNREFRTSKLVAAHLRGLGLDVKTGVAHTGVTAVLTGGRPGPTIALRADMDALPITEQTDVPFKSTVTSEYLGKRVGVMHACGHDAHVAILMGVAGAMASLRQDLPGTVLFVFQPAEEGAPEGEEGGAALMLKEGIFADPSPQAVFGLHVAAGVPSGVVAYRPGPVAAASDTFRIEVTGRQAHGAQPWRGVDAITAAAQIIMGLQTITSRQIDITSHPAVLTVGTIEGGLRNNIIAESVEMRGTLRTFDPAMRADIIERMMHTTQHIARSSGANANLHMSKGGYPVLHNDLALTERVVPSLRRVVGNERVIMRRLATTSEDFAFYAQQVPGFYFFVGITPAGPQVPEAPTNHSPLFYIDESAIAVATRALMAVAVDYLQGV